MLEALCLLVGVLIGAALARHFTQKTMDVAAGIIEDYRTDQVALLDRIQAPNLEEYKALTRPDFPTTPEPGFLYDPTGLVEVEVED